MAQPDWRSALVPALKGHLLRLPNLADVLLRSSTRCAQLYGGESPAASLSTLFLQQVMCVTTSATPQTRTQLQREMGSSSDMGSVARTVASLALAGGYLEQPYAGAPVLFCLQPPHPRTKGLDQPGWPVPPLEQASLSLVAERSQVPFRSISPFLIVLR